MKGYSTSLVIREIQMKNTLSYYFTLIRMAKILKMKTTTITTNVGEDVEKPEHPYTAGKNVNAAAAVKNNLAIPQKAKHRSSM